MALRSPSSALDCAAAQRARAIADLLEQSEQLQRRSLAVQRHAMLCSLALRRLFAASERACRGERDVWPRLGNPCGNALMAGQIAAWTAQCANQ